MNGEDWEYHCEVSQKGELQQYVLTPVRVPTGHRIEHPNYSRIRSIFSVCLKVPEWRVEVSAQPRAGVYLLCVSISRGINEEELPTALRFMRRDASCIRERTPRKMLSKASID